MYYIASNELYHHGVIGQKWGIRRYQPYPKGYTGSGKEIGQAAKVKQRDSGAGEKKPRYANNPKAAEILKKSNTKQKNKELVKKLRAAEKEAYKAEKKYGRDSKEYKAAIKKRSKANNDYHNWWMDKTFKPPEKSETREIGSSFLQNRKEKKAAKEAAAKKKEFVDRMNKAKADAKALKEQQAAAEAEKQRVLKEGTAAEVKKYASELSNQELQNVINRINLNKQLNDLVSADVKDGFDKIDAVMDKLKKVNTWMETGTKSYDNMVKVLNILDKEAKKRKGKTNPNPNPNQSQQGGKK